MLIRKSTLLVHQIQLEERLTAVCTPWAHGVQCNDLFEVQILTTTLCLWAKTDTTSVSLKNSSTEGIWLSTVMYWKMVDCKSWNIIIVETVSHMYARLFFSWHFDSFFSLQKNCMSKLFSTFWLFFDVYNLPMTPGPNTGSHWAHDGCLKMFSHHQSISCFLHSWLWCMSLSEALAVPLPVGWM